MPEDPTDKLLTKWSKSGTIGGKAFVNPVVNNTGDDPSTAWKLNGDETAEWRIIGNQACSPEGGNPVYGSKDFVEWCVTQKAFGRHTSPPFDRSGHLAGYPGQRPHRRYKVGCSTLMAGDCPTFFKLPKLFPGTERYLDAHGPLPNHVHKSGGHGGDQFQVGTWTDGKPGSEAEGGTPGEWQILPGTGTVFQDKGKTHASKDFFDPVKDRRILWVWGTVPSGIQTVPRELTYHPGLMRVVWNPVEEMIALRTSALGNLGASTLPAKLTVSNASDITLFFATPTERTALTADVGSGVFFMNFVPGPGNVTCGYNVSKRIPGTHGKIQGFTDEAPMLGDESYVTMRIFLDGTIGEVYFQEGRVAMTVPLGGTVSPSGKASGVMTIGGGNAAKLINATSFAVGDIHTTVEDVLA